jgi:hypothetical protein
LNEQGLANYFDGVYGGPSNKYENLQVLSLKPPVLYFGDCEVDYLVAKQNNYDFIFVYGACGVTNWEDKVKHWKLVKTIKNFVNEL